MLIESLRTESMDFIASGADSEVFRAGRFAVKKYRPTISFEKLYQYQAVTNAAIRHLKREDIVIHPISQVLRGREGVVFSVSDFVAGPTVEDIVVQAKEEELRRKIDLLENQQEADFFRGLMPDLHSSKLAEEIRQAHWTKIKDASIDLEQKLGADGISVVPLNVKVRFEPQVQRIKFVITDLCAGILRLGVKR